MTKTATASVLKRQPASNTVTIILSGPKGAGKRMIKRFLNYERRWLKSDYNINIRIIERQT